MSAGLIKKAAFFKIYVGVDIFQPKLEHPPQHIFVFQRLGYYRDVPLDFI